MCNHMLMALWGDIQSRAFWTFNNALHNNETWAGVSTHRCAILSSLWLGPSYLLSMSCINGFCPTLSCLSLSVNPATTIAIPVCIIILAQSTTPSLRIDSTCLLKYATCRSPVGLLGRLRRVTGCPLYLFVADAQIKCLLFDVILVLLALLQLPT